jgi:NitT/TauT family transport system substrate-binding protein
MSKSRLPLAVVFITIIFIFTGCISGGKDIQGELETINSSLKIGLMPATDSAPFLLAQERGYFENLGLNVELEIYSNPQNRQSALQTQSIDGAITDLIALATNVDGGFDIKAVTMTNGMFPILTKPGASEKDKLKVGMMEVSVTNFLIDKWLGGKYEIEKVFVTEIPARLAAIGSGELDMGIFPEPVASMGVLSGLEKKMYDLPGGYSPDVMVFTGKALKEKEEAIILFLQAYDKAVSDINDNPDLAIEILMAKIPNLDEEIKDLILLPEYTKTSMPDDDYIEDIIRWTSKVVKKDLDVTATQLVERKFTGNDSN